MIGEKIFMSSLIIFCFSCTATLLILDSGSTDGLGIMNILCNIGFFWNPYWKSN